MLIYYFENPLTGKKQRYSNFEYCKQQAYDVFMQQAKATFDLKDLKRPKVNDWEQITGYSISIRCEEYEIIEMPSPNPKEGQENAKNI